MQLALHADVQGGRRGSDCTAVGYYLFSLAKCPARAQTQTMYFQGSRTQFDSFHLSFFIVIKLCKMFKMYSSHLHSNTNLSSNFNSMLSFFQKDSIVIPIEKLFLLLASSISRKAHPF
jgi:hypothetical protein